MFPIILYEYNYWTLLSPILRIVRFPIKCEIIWLFQKVTSTISFISILPTQPVKSNWILPFVHILF